MQYQQVWHDLKQGTQCKEQKLETERLRLGSLKLNAYDWKLETERLEIACQLLACKLSLESKRWLQAPPPKLVFP